MEEVNDKKQRRRSARGRRSIVTIRTSEATSTAINVLSGSISNDKVADIKQRIIDIDEYRKVMEEETAEWSYLLEKYCAFRQKQHEEPLKRPSKRKASLSTTLPLQQGLRPRYLLNRVEQMFFNRYTECAKQKEIDELTLKRKELLEDIRNLDDTIAAVEQLYCNQQKEKIAEEEAVWSNLLKMSQTHLNYLSLKDNLIIS